MALQSLLLLSVALVTALLALTHTASSTRVVVPDIAGMIYPIAATSSHVQFGDPSSSSSSAYEIVTPAADSVDCTDTRLCLKLQISSEFRLDPFFLSRYDTNTPLVSATFDGYDTNDILPLIPGTTGNDAEVTVWWFQTNSSAADVSASTTNSPPVIDLLLRLRQRSQRLSARDQLLVQLRVELVDSSTTTSAVHAYGVYGNQRVKHSTRRVDSNVVRVDLAITKNSEKRDVDLSDAYPLLENSPSDSTNDFGASCDDCLAFLDSCGGIEVCNTKVMPCLLSKLEEMTSGSTSTGSYSGSQGVNAGDVGSHSGSGAMEETEAGNLDGNDSETGAYDLDAWIADFLKGGGSGSENLEESTTAIDSASGSFGVDSESEGSSGSVDASEAGSTNQVDLLMPLASCVADLPVAVWLPIRQALLCLSRSKCALGNAPGQAAGEVYPTIITMTNGSQKFSVTPAISGTNNVNFTIVTKDIRSGVTDQHTFEYTASASYLGMFLRAFVLNQAADVSVLVEASATDHDTLDVSLSYFNALMLRSVDFNTTIGNLSVTDESPAHVFIDYADSTSRPNLDIILKELRARVNPSDDTWILSENCLACSAELFGCSTDEITSKSCNYNSMKSTFGKCIRQQLSPVLFEEMMKRNASSRPISNELYRCLPEGSSTTDADALGSLLSALSCFAETRCPFGPIALVQKAQAVVLETTSYIQLLRISPSSPIVPSIHVSLNLDKLLIARTTPIKSTSSELEIQTAIKDAVGLDVSVSSLSGNGEWTLEIIYHNIFLPVDSFVLAAAVDDSSAGSATIKQIVMEGGEAQLRTVSRNKSTIFMHSEIEPTSPTGTLLSSDVCRKCASAMKRCQDSLACSSFSRDILVPSLRSIDITEAKVSSDTFGKKTYEFNLVPTLQAALPDSFEAWDALAAELYCFAEVKCDLEYESAVDNSMESHLPTYLSLDSILVKLSVRTYPDTQWTATTPNRKLTYTPSADVVSAIDAADAVLDWVKSTINETLPEVGVYRFGNWTVENTGAAVGIIAIYGQLDELINRYVMAPVLGLPSFSANPNTSNLPAPGISEAPWSLSLTSVGTKPQYNKFLDLLRFGADGNPNASTPATSIKYISQTDRCRECKAATLECQNVQECVNFSRDTLATFLRHASDQATINVLIDNLGHVERRLPLDSLFALASMELSSLESWDALSDELSCFAYRCDLEYDDVFVSDTSYHEPSYLRFEKESVTLHLLTYNDTQWNMVINGSELEYIPSASLTPLESAIALSDWVEAQVTRDPYNLSFSRGDITADTEHRFAAFNITLGGQWSELLSDRKLLSAPLVPSFEASGGVAMDELGHHPARVTVEPWELYLTTYNQAPQYSKFLELLTLGFIRDVDTGASGSSSPTPTSTSTSAPASSGTGPPSDGKLNCDKCAIEPAILSASDVCRQCTDALERCQNNDDCATTSSGLFAPFLRGALSALTTTQNADDTTRIEIDFASALRTLPSDVFTSTEAWHAIDDELICLASSSCEVGYGDGKSYLSVEEIVVIVHVTTFTNTAWKITLNGTEFSYSPTATVTTLSKAVAAFQSWLETWGKQEALLIHAVSWDDDGSSPATFDIKIFGDYDDTSGRYTMLSPALIPTFTAVDGTLINGTVSAEASVTPWNIKLFSTGQRPKYGKLLDLLGYGIAGTSASTPTPASTIASPSHEMGSNDICRHCGSVLAECQDDAACVSFSQYSVIPLLKDAKLDITTEVVDDYGAASFSADLYPILLPLSSSVNNTPAAWDLVAGELFCLAYDTCKVEYNDVCVSFRGAESCPGVDMDLARSFVDVRLLTYRDTGWNMTINGDVYSYIPEDTGLDIGDEAQQLQAWLKALNDDESLPLKIQVFQVDADASTDSATLTFRFLGTYMDELYQYAMVNPAMIPSFAVSGGTADGGAGAAQAYLTLPKLTVYSQRLKPQYSKLIDMLSDGIVGATASSAPSPTPTSASNTISSSDACRAGCQDVVDLCRADADCLSYQTSLASLLGSTPMPLTVRPQNDYGSGRVVLHMGSVLNASVSAAPGTSPRREGWDALAVMIACFSTADSCDLEYNDVVSPLLGSHTMTLLSIEGASALVSIRFYSDTAWSMWVGETELSYTPSSGLSMYDAPGALRDWITPALAADPFNFTVEQMGLQQDYASNSSVVVFAIRAVASDTTVGDAWLVPPWLIPRFEVAGGTAGGGDTGLPPAEANASLWDVGMVSIGQLPQFSKLLHILDSGLDR